MATVVHGRGKIVQGLLRGRAHSGDGLDAGFEQFMLGLGVLGPRFSASQARICDAPERNSPEFRSTSSSFHSIPSEARTLGLMRPCPSAK